MRRRFRSSSSELAAPALAAVLAASLGGWTWAEPARAQSPTGPSAPVVLAEQYAAAAFEAYERRDFLRAIRLYEQALDAAPSADISYNIARVYDLGLDDRRNAIDAYERYVADPGAASARLEVARSRLEELRAAEHADAERASLETEIRLDEIARELPLDPAEPAPLQQPAQPSDAGLRPLETAAITLGGMGLASIGVGIGFGIAARTRSDDWQRDCEGNLCSTRRGVDAAESARRSATIATVGFAAGGGLLALGAALWLIDAGAEPARQPSALHLEPFVATAGAGSLLSGSF